MDDRAFDREFGHKYPRYPTKQSLVSGVEITLFRGCQESRQLAYGDLEMKMARITQVDEEN